MVYLLQVELAGIDLGGGSKMWNDDSRVVTR